MTANTPEEINALAQSIPHPQPANDPISHLIDAIDVASLSKCYMKDLYCIFNALSSMTAGNQQVHGLVQVGLSLAERYEQEMLNHEHEFSSTLDALQGGA